MEPRVEGNWGYDLLTWAWDTVIGNRAGQLPSFLDGAAEQIAAVLPNVSPEQLAEEYLAKHDGDVETAINDFIAWQCANAGAAGFMAAAPGLIVGIAAIPVELALVTYLQLRMIATIAKMRGWKLGSDHTKTVAFLAMLGIATSKALAKFGAAVGVKLAGIAISKVPGRILIAINKMVGFRLVVKFGEKGMVRLANVVPIVGGLVSGGLNALTTKWIGDAASHLFKRWAPPRESGDDEDDPSPLLDDLDAVRGEGFTMRSDEKRGPEEGT
jgi:hypothetical protein